MKRMAFADPFQGKIRALQRPMFFHRLDCIFRASGEKAAAMPHEGTQSCLIEANDEDQTFFH
jgi:hypothetical protein